VALCNDIADFGHEFDAAFTAKNLRAARICTRRVLTLLTNFNAVLRGTDCEFPAAMFDDMAKLDQALDEGNWDRARQLVQSNAARYNDEAYAHQLRRITSQIEQWAGQQKQAAPVPVPAPVMAGPAPGVTPEQAFRQRYGLQTTGPAAAPEQEFMQRYGLQTTAPDSARYGVGTTRLRAVPGPQAPVPAGKEGPTSPAPASSDDPGRVVRVEEKLRREIEKRLSEAGWGLNGLSVSVSPDLRKAECRFETGRRDGSVSILIDGAIRITPQERDLWLVEGSQEFQFLRFSVDTSAEGMADAKSPSATWTSAVPALVKAPPGQYSVQLKPGVELEVAAIARTQAGKTTWWKPDGSPMDNPPDTVIDASDPFFTKGRTNDFFALVFKLSRSSDIIDYLWKHEFEPVPNFTGYVALRDAQGRLRYHGVPMVVYDDPFQQPPERIVCRVGVALTPASAVAVFDGTRVASASAPIPFRFFPPVKAGGSTTLRLECPLKQNEFEIVAFATLRDGRRLQSAANTAQNDPSVKEIRFSALPEDIKEYRVEFVPFYWCEFRDISLKPKSAPAQ
jgi:hypothetical protein